MSSFSEVLWPLSATVMPTPGGAGGSQEGVPLLSYVAGGGVIGFIIIGLSVLAICLIVIHAIQIRRASLMPESQIVEIGKPPGPGRFVEHAGESGADVGQQFELRPASGEDVQAGSKTMA